MEKQRGQTLPLTLGGIIAILVFGFFALNYANTLRWQIRAQNAADAAAQAMLSLQASQFNQMNAALYAAAIEEYRVRHLLNAMIMASSDQGGCAYSSLFIAASNGCYTIEMQLEAQYRAAVARYTADVLTLHQATVQMTFSNVTADAKVLLAKIASCSGQLGGDCAFKYGTPVIQKRVDTEAVYMDAYGVIKPSPNNQTALASSVGNANTLPLNTALFAPMQVEVSVCATVPSLIPNFLNWDFKPFYAVARGAATTVMVEEDWLQPGTIRNPKTNLLFQPLEYYTSSPVTDPNGYDWYDLNFGGNGAVAVNGQHYGGIITNDAFSAYIGWWNSIPIHPFSGPKNSLTDLGC